MNCELGDKWYLVLNLLTLRLIYSDCISYPRRDIDESRSSDGIADLGSLGANFHILDATTMHLVTGFTR